jgi:hypothetical protein
MTLKPALALIVAVIFAGACKEEDGLDDKYAAIAAEACKCDTSKCIADVEIRLIKLQTEIDHAYPKGQKVIPDDLLRKFKTSHDRFESCFEKMRGKTDMAGAGASATLDDAAHGLVKRYNEAADAMCACADPECKKSVAAGVQKLAAERSKMAAKYSETAYGKLIELMSLHVEKLEACAQ